MSKTNFSLCAHCGWDIDTGKTINKEGLEFCPACGNVVGLHHEQPTLRDQFAMAALVGLASGNGLYSPCDIAKYSYMAADAMLEEREK